MNSVAECRAAGLSAAELTRKLDGRLQYERVLQHEKSLQSSTRPLPLQFLRRNTKRAIMSSFRRADRRDPTEMRPLEMEVGHLSRMDGSARFAFGEPRAAVSTVYHSRTGMLMVLDAISRT